MLIDKEDYLAHYGILRKSGRYPWGSGNTQASRNRKFLDITDGLRKEGMSDVEIAKGFGMTTTELRAVRSIAGTQQRQEKIDTAQKLRDKGYSYDAIAQRMELPNESSVRALLAPGTKERADVLRNVSDSLRKRVDEVGYLDIGEGVENNIGIAKDKLRTAVAILKEEGYEVHPVQVDQLGTKNKTTFKVLSKPGTTYRDVVANKDNIRQINEFSDDHGRTMLGIKPPIQINPKRVGIRYAEDGGKEEDGVIYVRPGVKDLSLGGNTYGQVRIAVGGSHYLKGMAVLRDDLPDGVDLVFNTNKSRTKNKLDVMKATKDEDNPFGSTIRQIIEVGPDGSQKVTSAMNFVGNQNKDGSGGEGTWDSWSKNLSTQVLSKQSHKLARQQLDLTFQEKRDAFDEIMALTNPAVKRKLLEEFADSADSSAVHLKAAKLPRQSTRVILPMNSLKETEVYAPTYRDGEKVVLIRYPHAGPFEIPELTVNNRHAPAKKLLGNAVDAVAINSKVAERLSGADFDGDFVLVIPNNNKQIKTAPALQGLKGFDPQRQYKAYDGMKTIDGGVYNEKTAKVEYGEKGPSSRGKGMQMGLVSNLITDMTIKGASPDELSRAVRHSMVVIDAEKHSLDWRKSKQDFGIKELESRYQKRPDGQADGGSSTLISRARGDATVAVRKLRSPKDGGPIDPKTGKLQYREPESYVDRNGRVVVKTERRARLSVTEDAFNLSSGTEMETIYAEHSNRLKSLANEARKETLKVKNTPISLSAKAVYKDEVESLNAKLSLARRNKPLERQAQVFANAILAQKKAENPNMDDATLKKVKSQALATARARTQAQKQKITPTAKEWAAIQAGAISNYQLSEILKNADIDAVRALATPRTTVLMTATKSARARTMLAAGYTQAEVADALGVSTSTLKVSLTS